MPAVHPKTSRLFHRVSTICVMILLAGCAGQMPSVASFMAPKQLWNDYSATAMAGGRTFFVDGWSYGCKPFSDTTGGRGGLLTCSESNTGLHRYDEPAWRVGSSLYLGNSWRIGVDGGSFSASAGWKTRDWGVMTWINPTLGWEGGAAIAQQWNPKNWFRLGTFEYFSSHPYIEWYPKDSISTSIVRDVKEIGAGGWIQASDDGGVSLEGKIGKEIGHDRFRYYLTATIGFGSDFKDLFPHGDPKP